MAIDPELALKLASSVSRIYADAETVMIERVSRRLARGIEESGWAERKLAEVETLRREAAAEVARLKREGPEAVRRALTQGFGAGVEGAAVITGEFTGSGSAALEALIGETTQAVTSTHFQLLRSVQDGYRKVIAESSLPGVVTGTKTRREAAQRSLEHFARKGVTGFVDKAGRQWRLESYTEMATRTGAGHAMIEGRLTQYQAGGHDLVIVSDAPEECPVCRKWEGKVLSISGKTTGQLDRGFRVAGTVAQARSAGLFHANCRHNLARYVPGLTKRMKHTADPVKAEERVRQRELERRLRERKRQEAAARAWVEEDASPEAKLKAAQSKQKVGKARGDLVAFIGEHDRKRLPYREQIRSAI